ncbi:MAG TPA: DUF1801 domain-containing protein [Patescibacteria group bacterium]|nr:DUF1801 domain-containing protein [Patescibacteria group bacterium]
MNMMDKYSSVDEYLANFSGETREKLDTLRQTIKEVVPEASEKIAYGIPTFTFHGNLVHFAGYETHIGFYPGSAPIQTLKDKLKGFETSKGTIRFSLDKPLPLDLIKDITKVAIARNLERKKK